jgi:hypothetical protein
MPYHKFNQYPAEVKYTRHNQIHIVLYLKIKIVKSKQKFMKKMYKTRLIRVNKLCMCKTGCGTVVLMVLYQFTGICGPHGYGFHHIKNFRNCAVEILHRFFANFCHEIGCENDQTYIFRFVKYLSTFFYTYLPVNIHFQLIIITDISILTDPACFVPPSCHCGILALRSREF